MKVLQVITSLHVGGAEKLIVDMVPLYRKQGIEVDVLLFDGTDTPFKKQLQEEGVRVYELGKGGSVYNPLHVLRLIPFVRRYDIVHTHNTAPQLFGALAGVFSSVVLLTTEHSTSNRRRKWKGFRPIDRWMYSRYRKVICISGIAESNLRHYLGGEGRNICTISNGVNVGLLSEAKPLPALREQAAGKCVAVMVAGFRYEKDQDTLIKAFRYLPSGQYELWLVGDGGRRPLLEALVKEAGLQESVRFLGLRSDVPSVLKSADVVVLSSHFEGLSLSSLEGMAVGKPFVASDVDGLREVVGGYGVLFPHGDDRALAQVIKRLNEDEDYRQEVAKACFMRASEYDIHRTVEKYVELYRGVL